MKIFWIHSKMGHFVLFSDSHNILSLWLLLSPEINVERTLICPNISIIPTTKKLQMYGRKYAVLSCIYFYGEKALAWYPYLHYRN